MVIMRSYKIGIKNKKTKEHKLFNKEYLTFAEAFQFAQLKTRESNQYAWEIQFIKLSEDCR